MADAHVNVQIGKFSFSAEGSEAWIAAQLTAVLDRLPSLVEMSGPTKFNETEVASSPKETAQQQVTPVGSLASYIKAKNGDSNQNSRFLATADWLRLKGTDPLKTSLISKALQDNHQKRLSNPADCLNQNVSKGLCEKTNGGFFITPEGLRALGHAS